jgi:hypothetical protein
MSTTSRKIMFLGSTALPVLKVDNLTTICEPIVTVGSLTSHNLILLHGVFRELLYFLLYISSFSSHNNISTIYFIADLTTPRAHTSSSRMGVGDISPGAVKRAGRKFDY